MGKRIVINLPDDCDVRQARFIAMDALYEFVSHRGPTAEEYVNKRYPDNPQYAWLDRAKKVQEVNRRILLATVMHQSVEVEE